MHHRRGDTHDRGHAAFPRGHGFLHIGSAFAHQAHRIGKVQRSNRHERRVLAQAVAGDKVRRQTLFRHHAISRHRHGQNGRLRVRRELQFLFAAFKAHFGDGEAQRMIRFLKHSAGRGIIFRQLFAHARVLRRLPRKHKRYFSHTRLPLQTLRLHLRQRQFLFDSFIDARARQASGYTDGILDRIRVGSSVADHAHAPHAQ